MAEREPPLVVWAVEIPLQLYPPVRVGAAAVATHGQLGGPSVGPPSSRV